MSKQLLIRFSLFVWGVLSPLSSCRGGGTGTVDTTVLDVIEQLKKNGYLTLKQVKDITNIYPDNIARDPMSDRNLINSVVNNQMIEYLNEELIYGKLSKSTFYYIATLMKLRREKKDGQRRKRFLEVPDINDVSSPAPASYEGNGVVELLGHFNPAPKASSDSSSSDSSSSDSSSSESEDELSYGGYQGIWGYVGGAREYALLTHSNGLHIIDVTDATNPFRVQFIPMDGGYRWRDVEIWQNSVTQKIFAYVGAQSDGNLIIVDLTVLSHGEPHDVDGANCPYTDRGRKDYGHTVTVGGEGLLIMNTASASDDDDVGCYIFDLEADAWNPPLVGKYSRTSRALTDCHDSIVRKNMYVPSLKANRTILISADGYAGVWRLVDITDTENPTILGQTDEPSEFSYAHSHTLDEAGELLYVFEESNTYDIGIWNVSDPSHPKFVNSFSYSNNNDRNSLVHNGHIRGNELFVAYYEAGFRIFDVTDPLHPIETGKFDTYFDPDYDGKENDNIVLREDYYGAWNLYPYLPSGIVLVSDLWNGLYIFKVRKSTDEPEIPTTNPNNDDQSNDDPLNIDLCFSSNNEIIVDGVPSSIKNLKIGDSVMVDEKGNYGKVYSFGHYEPNAKPEYIEIHSTNDKTGAPLILSEAHMVFVEKENSKNVAIRADQIQVGDKLVSVIGDDAFVVSHLRKKKSVGAYAPFTDTGTIVVNGVVASCYVALQDSEKLFGIFSHHSIAYSFESPHRLYCSLVVDCSNETYTMDGISKWVALPFKITTWLLDKSNRSIWMQFLFVPILFVILCFLTLTKNITNVMVVQPKVFVAMVVLLVLLLGKSKKFLKKS